MQDLRFFRLICCWVAETPSFEKIFPMWAMDGDGESAGAEFDNDEESFRQVTAMLTPYRN